MSEAEDNLSKPFAFYKGHIPAPAAGASKIVQHTGAKTGASIAVGMATYKDKESDYWTVWYDEVIALHATDGSFEVEYDGQTVTLEVGDFVWIRANTTVRYRSHGSSTLFYAATPPDWRERGMPAKPVWP